MSCVLPWTPWIQTSGNDVSGDVITTFYGAVFNSFPTLRQKRIVNAISILIWNEFEKEKRKERLIQFQLHLFICLFLFHAITVLRRVACLEELRHIISLGFSFDGVIMVWSDFVWLMALSV